MKTQANKGLRAQLATFVAIAIVLPGATMAMAGEPGAKQDKQLPLHLRSYKSPLNKKRTQALVDKGTKKYGPGKHSLVRFKKSATKVERAAAIKGVGNVMTRMKADPKLTPALADSIKVWEAMSPAQKNEVLAQTDAVVAVWPAGVAATAAAVTAAVAVADFTYKVYVDQRDRGGDDDGDDEGEDEPDDGGDTGDDTGIIRGALSY